MMMSLRWYFRLRYSVCDKVGIYGMAFESLEIEEAAAGGAAISWTRILFSICLFFSAISYSYSWVRYLCVKLNLPVLKS